MAHFEDAIGYLEQQLATLEQISSTNVLVDKVYIFFFFVSPEFTVLDVCESEIYRVGEMAFV